MIDPPLYTLGDAVQLHRQHPETFNLCSEEDRESLRVGDVAQLAFSAPGFKTERMWVLVIGRFRNKYVGTVNNAPIQPSFPLSFGDKLTFSARNIYQLAQLPPFPKDSTFLAEEAELARQMLNEQRTPASDACSHCGNHDADSIEHGVSVRVLAFRSIAAQAFIDGMKKAWARHDYQTVARAGAERGKFLMAEDVGKVPNEELGFAPEFYIFDKDGNFGAVDFPGMIAEEDISQVLPMLFANKKPDGTKIFEDIVPEGVLLIISATISKTCKEKLDSLSDPEAQRKEFHAHPPTSYPDKITVSDARVFLSPDKDVANAGILVGTKAELAAAGFGEPKAA